MKKMLLTGGSGFIGRNIQESFLAQKYEIMAPRHAELDLADTSSVDEYFSHHEFDVVLHAAVKPGHRNAKDPTNLFYNNMRMFENLERHKNDFGKLINFGSGAIYDVSANNANVSEDQIYQHMGKDEHSFCKYVMQKQIDKLDNFVNLNIFGIFGKYEDYSIRLISNAICKAIFGLPITLRQNRRFSYLDVNDLPQILEWFIENNTKYKSYNVVPDDYVELRQIAEIVGETALHKVDVQVASDGFGLDYYGSNARLKSEMENVSFTELKESIAKLYKYYEEHKDLINYDNLLKDK